MIMFTLEPNYLLQYFPAITKKIKLIIMIQCKQMFIHILFNLKLENEL